MLGREDIVFGSSASQDRRSPWVKMRRTHIEHNTSARPPRATKIVAWRQFASVPLLGHHEVPPSCPLPGVKRSCREHRLRSESDPKLTWGPWRGYRKCVPPLWDHSPTFPSYPTMALLTFPGATPLVKSE
jgi:hypothetical protein